jgi:poly-gamma-glutamate synthesis protein (capsule biosynthesis protein)
MTEQGVKERKSYNFRFKGANAAALKAAGVDGLLVANNHAFDYGRAGFIATLAYLQNAGLAVIGGGHNIDEAASPRVLRIKGLVVNLFGIGSFPRETRSGWDGSRAAATPAKAGILFADAGGRKALEKQLRNHNKPNELNLVFFHGGQEYAAGPDARTRRLYAALARAGADALIGTHPHVVQGFEWLEQKPVFWSLGDFVFPDMGNAGDKGLLVRLGFLGKKLVYLDLFPTRTQGKRAALVNAGQLALFYRRTKL